jgi:hypothetical protein
MVEANIGADEVPFVLVFVSRFLNPLQGLFNLAVFIQPQVRNVHRENPDLSSIKAFLIGIRTLDLDQRTSMRVSRRLRRSSRHLASISVQVPRSSGIVIDSIKAFFHSRNKNADKDEDSPADIPPRSQNIAASNQIPLDPSEEDDPDLKFGLGLGSSLYKLDDVSGKGATSHLLLKSKDSYEDSCPSDIPPRSQNIAASNQMPLDPSEEDGLDLKFGLG